MEINNEFWATVVFTVINILLLYFILKKILFKPVNKYMTTRSNKIKEALNMAEEAKTKVEKMEAEHQAKLKEMKEQGEEMMASYKKKADKEKEEIISKAKEEADRMIINAREELATEKEQLMASLKDEISTLVLAASEKVLNKNLDEKTNKELIDSFIKEKK
jgi:F-type H+-transporting ATPase subunit b